jgi:hypothetical protein
VGSVTLNPSIVLGGKSVEAKVTLECPAAPGDITVTLTSGDPATAAPTQASMVIPAGQQTATFTINTTEVRALKRITLTAAANKVAKAATLTVKPNGIRALALTPTSVVGSLSVLGTVVLDATAGAGGVTVQLGSSDPTVAAPPATLLVPEGKTSAVFEVKTSAVAALTTIVIKATANGLSKSASLRVKPVGVLSVSGTPNPALSGEEVTGLVVLEATAAPGDITVTLTSGSPDLASVPTSVVVPAGSNYALFTIKAGIVTTSRRVAIKAAVNGVTKSFVLTINP